MKVLLSANKTLLFALGIVALLSLLCCAPALPPATDQAPDDPYEEDDETPQEATFTLYAADGTPRTEGFCVVCRSEHAIAYVQAHAVKDETAKDLLDRFEAAIFPALPVPAALSQAKLSVLLLYQEGHIYGFTPFPVPEEGPIVCLNALYAEDLVYTLAHEYQHLCAHDAFQAGDTSLSEETDELFSDIFCERLFPGEGKARGILTDDRGRKAQEKLLAWGDDALSHAYGLLRAGYSEEQMLSTMENR